MASMSPQRIGISISKTSTAACSAWLAASAVVRVASFTFRSLPASEREAVVGSDDRAVDETRLIGGQQQHHAIEVFRLADAPARQHLNEFLSGFGFPVMGVDLGFDVARADRI